MSHDKDISDEDRELFQEAMKGVKPLKPHGSKVFPPSSSIPIRRSLLADSPAFPVHYSLREDIGPEEVIAYAKNGLSEKQLRELKRGPVAIEATLDLHQMTVDEALQETQAFLHRVRAQGKRCVRIVHGKGYLSKNNKPLLKSTLNTWLREQPFVLGFHSCQGRHGGAGAVYVLLKMDLE
ncbi:MAG TPA: Smr/MutS family protein [Coxiellaceae bacterium]|nr:Smr/MutS family protein [Coxiellaceae bacterium]